MQHAIKHIYIHSLQAKEALNPLRAAQFPGGEARSCEDLKARYYGVARALAVAREGSEEGIANATLVRHPFNAQHERCACALRPPER